MDFALQTIFNPLNTQETKIKMPCHDKTRADDFQARLSLKILKSLQSSSTYHDFLNSAIPVVLRFIGSETGGLVTQHAGKWTNEHWCGEVMDVPDGLVSEAIDTSTSAVRDDWFATPLEFRSATTSATGSPSALVFRLPAGGTDRLRSSVGDQTELAVELLAAAAARVQSDEQNVRRMKQLQSVLTAAAAWQRMTDDEALLERIAATATKLLDCERASIFLWDRRRKKLIGRPALGVMGVPLEVDDNVGVVGEVLASGESKIWNSNGQDVESRVNRSVDWTLDFQTRSLVAVAMFGHRGDQPQSERIGVFEAINHRGDGFGALDVAVLSDLALHAAVAIDGLRTRKSLAESCDRLVAAAASAAPIIGNHPAMEAVRQNADRVAKTDLTVLILGSNGTGKEVLARHIHYQSNRRHAPFIAVNCAALVESLLESELFGHERGSFTDASQTRIGKFELASGGTLFLDEIGDLSPGGQAKLLRVLEDKVVVRVGGTETIGVDVRVIAATNQPLETQIAEKHFREDLFFRLNVVSLKLPPLAARGDDVLLLAEHFMSHFSQQIGRLIPKLEPLAIEVLRNHPWPGNIRELRNTIERICYLCPNEMITDDDLRQNGLSSSSGNLRGRDHTPVMAEMPDTLCEATRIFQIAHIERAIGTRGGNMTEAADHLGVHRSNLYRKMRQLGMGTA